MSRFLGKAAASLSPYTPGEQPQGKQYIKLNTNESPYSPSTKVVQAVSAVDAADYRLYPDPEVKALTGAVAKAYGIDDAQVFPGAGSDEVLGYAFMAFFDKGDKVFFADITYGFYMVYARLCGLEAVQIPLRDDFSLAVEDYSEASGHIVIANPNAPTGIALEPAEIEKLLQNRDRLVIVDEAYVDFAPGKICLHLLDKYDNLLIVQTFSKSRSLAGMRVGCGLGHPELIAALNRMKFSFNPYNLGRTAIAAGVAAVEDKAHLASTVERVIRTREKTIKSLAGMGFRILPSETNFLLASHPGVGGFELYQKLKENGILVRHFAQKRIEEFVRITIGSDDDMAKLVEIVRQII